MDWKTYEIEIFESFKSIYPDAIITKDARIEGRYSKTSRQIDVLIETKIAGVPIRIIVDGKHYKKKIDVKHVETFISMAEDVEADQGILITPIGYSKAARNRAYYGPKHIEVDVLNYEELKQFQGVGAMPYSGKHGVLIPAPFGWIVDGTRRPIGLATLYQRGLTLQAAMKNEE
ncbi:MAG TPA: restriction endonuclease [Bacteroidia bacterium]|nr:restriction endonuclease [Bacteroidia bacterium]